MLFDETLGSEKVTDPVEVLAGINWVVSGETLVSGLLL